MPTVWKSANIAPLAKVNPPTLLHKHIRPISLTPVLAKLMESFTCKWVMDAGSIKGSSTVHALVEMVHLWQQALDQQGKVLRILLLDYSKAFDRVDHTLLLQKLANSGVHDCLTRWFTSFLCGRRQRTKIGDTVSEWSTINAGVPQGTLFGPVGFVIHINDLHTRLPTFKYVDDSTLWEVYSLVGGDSQLQEATSEGVQWSDDNLMDVNCDKTKELLACFARKVPDIPCITIKGKPIERVTKTKLLGVTISSDLTWDAHITELHSKGSQRLYFLRLLQRAGVASAHIVRVYVTLVRSLLEYACQVWHTGLTIAQSDTLESIQKRAMSIALPDLCYRDALAQAHLTTLHDRREELCRRFFHAMMVPNHKLHHLLPSQRTVHHRLRRQTRFPTIRAKHERYKKTLIPYGLEHWQ